MNEIRPEIPQDGKFLTVKQFSLVYGLNESTVRCRIRAGELKTVKPHKNRVLILDPGWGSFPPSAMKVTPRKHEGALICDEIHILHGNEVAALLGISPRGLRYLAQVGRIGFLKNGVKQKSHRRYSVADVRKLMAVRASQKRQCGGKTRIREVALAWAKERLGLNPLQALD